MRVRTGAIATAAAPHRVAVPHRAAVCRFGPAARLAGLFNTRQVLLATFDQELHTLPAIPPDADDAALAAARAATDTDALLRRLHHDVLRIPMTHDTNFGGAGPRARPPAAAL